MAVLIDGLNYTPKDLDWFLNDNSYNKVIYRLLCIYAEDIDLSVLFNEAYKVCTRIYEEEHPELYFNKKFELNRDINNPSLNHCTYYKWIVVYLILSYNIVAKRYNNKNIKVGEDIIINILHSKLSNNLRFNVYNIPDVDNLKKEEDIFIKNNSDLKCYQFEYKPISLNNVKLESYCFWRWSADNQKGFCDLIESIATKEERIKIIDYAIQLIKSGIDFNFPF